MQVQLNGTDAQLLISVSKPAGQLFHTVCCALSEAIYHIVSFAIGLAILQTLGKNIFWKVMMKIETETNSKLEEAAPVCNEQSNDFNRNTWNGQIKKYYEHENVSHDATILFFVVAA